MKASAQRKENIMEVKAFFDKDTRRFHRFLIDTEEVKGTIYFARDGERIPDKLTISLETSREKIGD